MSKTILIDASNSEQTRIAVTINDKLDDFEIESNKKNFIVSLSWTKNFLDLVPLVLPSKFWILFAPYPPPNPGNRNWWTISYLYVFLIVQSVLSKCPL